MSLNIKDTMSLMQSCFYHIFKLWFISFNTRYVYQSKRMACNRQMIFFIGFCKIVSAITHYQTIFFLTFIIKKNSKGLDNCALTCICFSKESYNKIIPHSILQSNIQFFLGFLYFRIKCKGYFFLHSIKLWIYSI